MSLGADGSHHSLQAAIRHLKHATQWSGAVPRVRPAPLNTRGLHCVRTVVSTSWVLIGREVSLHQTVIATGVDRLLIAIANPDDAECVASEDDVV